MEIMTILKETLFMTTKAHFRAVADIRLVLMVFERLLVDLGFVIEIQRFFIVIINSLSMTK